MLISHRHRFIFVHVYKNAGTSIMNALMPFCVPRWQLIGNLHWRERRQEGVNRFMGRFNSSLNPQPLGKHSSAVQIRDFVGAEAFHDYFSFAIVRNPWDWQVSLYTYMLKTPEHYQHHEIVSLGNFDDYIRWRCVPGNMPLQRNFVCAPDGEQLVDEVSRYESLDSDFERICTRIGIRASLPRLNVSNTKPYREYYNEETRELVRKFSQPDIELFGYDF